MKAIAFAAAIAVVSQPAFATGLAETLVEPEVIVEETRNPGSGGFIIPLLLLAAIVAVTSGGGDPIPKVPELD